MTPFYAISTNNDHENRVYKLESFIDEHPGGPGPILKQAGKDATAAFDPIHPSDVIEKYLPPELYLGDIDPSTLPAPVAAKEAQALSSSPEQLSALSVGHEISKPHPYSPPPLDQILNLWDFEAVAQKVLKKESWAYYSSAADDEITNEENHLAYGRLLLKPRVLVNVKEVNFSTSLLGVPSTLPLYITACALGKLGHPEGEVCLTRAAGSRGIIQMMPTLASCSMDEMVRAKKPGQPHWFQLYVNSNRAISQRLVQSAEKLGAKALFITVDAPALGRRERDMRVKFVDEAPDVQKTDPTLLNKVDRAHGVAKAISSFIDSSLDWEDLAWFRSITSLPICLKGIQCGEDAVLAARAGIKAIVISNHGGRQIDTCRASMDILPEVVHALKKTNLFGKMEIYIDGGIRRGTDVFKALALGANAVGIGRPFLYAMSGYGSAGVERAIDLLRDEFAMVMRLMGTRSLAEINPSFVCRASDYGCGAASWKAHL